MHTLTDRNKKNQMKIDFLLPSDLEIIEVASVSWLSILESACLAMTPVVIHSFMQCFESVKLN